MSESTTTPLAVRVPGCVCPRCGNQYLMRLTRTGFFENRLFPLFGYFPWVCRACWKRKYFRTRGKPAMRSTREQ